MLESSWRGTSLLICTPVLILAAAGGCNLMKALSVHTAPHTEKIDAEYVDLASKKVVVYVWAKPETLWDYPQMRLDLASHISAYFRENLGEVEVVPAGQVEAYLKTLPTMNPDPADVGRHFHADTVVHVSVYKFSMRDPGLSQFYRGRISASVVVLDLTGEDGTVRRVPLPDVTIAVPEDGPLGYHNVSAEQMRDMTYREFTQTTGRKFHAWEREAR